MSDSYRFPTSGEAGFEGVVVGPLPRPLHRHALGDREEEGDICGQPMPKVENAVDILMTRRFSVFVTGMKLCFL